MQNENKYTLTKYACYLTGITMSVTSCVSPVLFMTFRKMYGVSYTLLGFLVVVNFLTQLLVDLIFTFFSKRFNIEKTVRMMPAITFSGLIIYAVMPAVFPNSAYMWICVGTIIFSVAAGLSEVLTSPVVAAIPSENPEREMSKLHSAFAWGVVAVAIISTLFITFFGADRWNLMIIMWSAIPLVTFFIFRASPIPPMKEDGGAKIGLKLNKGIVLCTICIFLGGAAECTMAQWVSGFAESAAGVPKIWGDIFGTAMFSAFLGMGRTLYSVKGKRIIDIMLLGMTGATLCYVFAALVINPVSGLAACALTGLFTSMLWPGTIICMEENIKGSSVAVYALLASGGDMGASVAPQIVGFFSDFVAETSFAEVFSEKAGITAEQLGMRSGVLTAALFPLAGIFVVYAIKKHFQKNKREIEKKS